MTYKCPNLTDTSISNEENTGQFNKLVSELGEPLAYLVWNRINNGEPIITSVETKEDIKPAEENKTTRRKRSGAFDTEEDSSGSPNINEIDSSGSPLSITSYSLLSNQKQENDIVNTLTSAILTKVDGLNKKGEKYVLDNIINQLFEDLIIDYEFYNDYSNGEITEDDIKEGALPTNELNKKRADGLKQIIDNFEEVKVGDNIKFVGYKYRIKSKIASLKFSLLNEFDSEEDITEKTSFEDKWMFKLDPEKSMSAQVKRLLSFIPKQTEEGKNILNSLGYKSYEDYNKVFALISNELVDVPMEQMKDRLTELSERNIIARNVLKLLENMSKDDEMNFNKFMSVFRKQQAQFITILSNPEEKDGNRSFNVIDTNRSAALNIVVDKWYENFKKSEIMKFDDTTGEYVIDNEKAKLVVKEFETNFDYNNIKDWDKKLDIIVSSLNKIGIDITKEDLEVLNKYRAKYQTYPKNINKYSKYYKSTTFNDFVATELRFIFNTLVGKVSDQKVDEAWQTNNPFHSQSERIKGLSPYYLERNPNVGTDTFRDGNNNMIQSKVMPHYMSNRISKINTDDTFRSILRKVPFIKNASWLNQSIKLKYIDVSKAKGTKQEAKSYTEQSSTEREYTRMILFQNGGKNNTFFVTNTPSDKSTMPVIETERHIIALGETNAVFDKGTINKELIDLNSPTVNLLYDNLVQSEINRINNVRVVYNKYSKNNLDKLLPGYHYYYTDKKTNAISIGSGNYFYFIPELNEIAAEFTNSEGLLTLGKEGEKRFKEVMIDKIISLINDKVNSWNEKGIVNVQTGKNDFDKYYLSKRIKASKDKLAQNIINYSAGDFVINTMISYANQFMLITGDPALFFTKQAYEFKDYKQLIDDTADNLFKRVAKDIAPGIEGYFESNTFKTLFIKEPKYTSELSNLKDKLKSISNHYVKLDIADAQEWTTLKEHLNVLYAYGKINKVVRDNLINKAEMRLKVPDAQRKEYDFTSEELGTVLQPIKPVYVNSKFNEEWNTDVHYYIKTSSFPLIPQLTEGMEIDKLRLAMENPKNNIDRAVVNSGVKVGFDNPAEIFESDGSVKDLTKIDLSLFTKTLSREGFRIQQEVPYDPFKDAILEGSQLRKLKFANLTPDLEFSFSGNDKVKGYELKSLDDKIHNRLYEIRFNKLKKSLGIPEGESTVTDINKLKDILREEAENLNYNINDILFLQNTIQLQNGQIVFEVPLFFHNQSDKIESMLNSIIKNKVLKNKMAGKSFVQGSSVGFVTQFNKENIKNEEFLEEMLKSKPDAKIVFTKDSNGERIYKDSLDYRVYKENGKEIIYGEVFLPFNFLRKDEKGNDVPLKLSDYIDKDGMLKADKIDERLLNVLGYRIPTQGHSSMIQLKVVGFLPEESGDLVIVPAAITKQMGADFDVDKLYVHSYNYKEEIGGSFKKIDYPDINFENINIDSLSEEQLQNMSMDITFSILSNETVQNKYQFEPTDDPTLKNDKKVINSYKDNNKLSKVRTKSSESTLLYDEFQSHMTEVNAAGKIGIGSYSSSSANHVLFQYGGVYIKSPFSKERGFEHSKAVVVKFKDEDGNIFTDSETDDNRVNDKSKIKYTGHPLEGAWRLDKIITFKSKFNPDGKLISNVIKSFQSASVDNAKDQNLYDLHQNNSTFNVSSFIARSGFDEYYINRFITQPIIIKYIKELNDLNRFTDSKFEANKKGKLQKKLFDELGFDLYNWSYGITAVSLSEMEEAIKNNGQDKALQAKMLYNFIEYDKVASEITKLQSALNTDTAFLGQSIYESVLKKRVLDNTNKIKSLGNIQNLITDTTQGGAIQYGLNASIELFSNRNLFPFNSDAINTIYNTISYELDKELTSDLAHDIFVNIRSALYSQAINTVFGKDINSVRKDLLYGTDKIPSLTKRLQQVQENTNNLFLKNLIIKTANKKTDPDVTEFSASKEVKEELNLDMILGWNTLLTSENESERNLGEELVMYSLLIGNQRNARDFGRFLPYDYISDKLAEYYRSITLNEDTDSGVYGDIYENLVNNFVTQWFQHNPYKAREIEQKHIFKAQTFNGDVIKDATVVPDIIELKPQTTEDNELKNVYEYEGGELRYPEFISLKINKKEINLYKKIQIDGKVLYQKIPVLGHNDKLLKEYNITNPINQSVFRESINEVKRQTVEISEIAPNIPEQKQYKDTFDKYNFSYEKGLKGVLEAILEKSITPEYKSLAKFYLNNVHLLDGYNIDYYDSNRDANPPFDITGYDGKIFFDEKLILLNKDYIKKDSQFEYIFLHEVLHGILRAKLGKSDKSNKELLSLMDKLKKYEDKLYDVEWLKSIGVTHIGNVLYVEKENLNRKGFVLADYVFTDTQEFAAHLMNSLDFQTILKNLPYDGDKSFWDVIKQFIIDLLGIDTGNSMLTEGMNIVLNIINDKPIITKKTIPTNINQITEFEGTIIEYVDHIGLHPDGREMGARNVNKGEKIQVVMKAMKEKFDNKTWMTPASSEPLPENAFNTFEEFMLFMYLHEKAHEYIFQENNESKGKYETRINNEAMRRLNEEYNRPQQPIQTIKTLIEPTTYEFEEYGTYYRFKEYPDGRVEGEYAQGVMGKWTPLNPANIYRKFEQLKRDKAEQEGLKYTPSGNSITFNDGITISTGNIKLNSQQEEALKKMASFVTDKNAKTFALKGYAGTGKTTIINILKEYLKEKSKFRGILTSSPTHRANAVMKQKGVTNVYTLHSVFGLSPEIELEKFDSRDAKFIQQNKKKINSGDLLIIDESSMINDELYSFITTTAKNSNVQVLFIGDPAQLKPVKQEKLSKAFSEVEDSYELTKVERTGDNPLLKESMDLRNNVNKGDFSGKTSLNSNEEGVIFTNRYENFLDEAFKLFNSEEFQKNPLLVRMLSATNKIVDDLNNKIRLGLWGDDVKNEYNPGEIIMGYSNWKVDYQTGEPKLSNSGDYQIISVEESSKKLGDRIYKGYNLLIKDLINNKTKPFDAFIISKDTPSADIEYLGKLFEELVAIATQYPKGSKEAAMAWQRLSAFKDSFMTPVDIYHNGRSKINTTFKYGYAHTIHKSQGGTYKYSFVHGNSIDSAFKDDREIVNQLKYVAVTRAEKLSFIFTSSTKEDSSAVPSENTKRIFPVIPKNRKFEKAIDKDGHYIVSGRNKKYVIDKYFRYRGNIDFNSKNLPYTTFSYGNPVKDIALKNEINKLFTGNVVAYSPSEERIIFTPDADSYNFIWEVPGLNYTDNNSSGSPSFVEPEITNVQKLINLRKSTLEYFKRKLTERGVNRDELKKKITDLETSINLLSEKKSEEIMVQVIKNTISSVREELKNTSGLLEGSPTNSDIENIILKLSETDLYLEGLLTIQEMFVHEEGSEKMKELDLMVGDITRLKNEHLSQLKEAMTKYANMIGSKRLKDITSEELFSEFEDIDFFTRELKNMAESPSMLIRFLHQVIQQAKYNIIESQREISTSVDTWRDKLEKHLGLKGNKLWDIFLQKYEDGSWTGNYISRYKQEFFNERRKIINNIKNKEALPRDLLNWLKDNTTSITEEEINSGKSSVFSEEEMKEQLELIKKYKEDSEIQRQVYEDTFVTESGQINEEEVNIRMMKWEDMNSPLVYLKYYNGTLKKFKAKPRGYKYLINPKIKDKWLDRRFDKITNDPVLSEFYNFMVTTFKENNKNIPYERKLQGNYLPEMLKDFSQKIKEGSVFDSYDIFTSELWETITNEVQGEVDYTIQINNRRFKPVSTKMMHDTLTPDEKSKDVFSIIKAHSAMANSYKYKTRVEPVLNSGKQVLNEIEEISIRDTSKGNTPTKNMWKRIMKTKGQLFYSKTQLENQIEVFLYENYRDIEGRGKKIYKSSKDEEKVKLLNKLLEEGKITQEQYNTRTANLGRQITATGVMDVVSKYTYLKALGLPNFATPTVNLTFGISSNLIYAAGNQGTNLTDMRKALNMFMGAVIDKKQLKKIWAFMEQLGILNEYNESLYGTKRTVVDTMAFYLQNNTEKINRGTLMLAHLLTNKVKNTKGEDVSLYYAFKEVDGKLIWDNENFGEMVEPTPQEMVTEHGVNMFKLKSYITRINQRVHGDYDSALRAKRTIIGRALTMFKTWLPMAITERFGKEDYDDELERMFKGRYTVLWTAKDNEGNEMSTKEFLKLITKASFTKEGLSPLSETDRALVRRNLKELQFIAQFAIAVMAITLVAGGADEDDELRLVLNTFINILSKAQADLAFFTSPSAASQMLNNMVPLTSTIRDITNIVPVVIKTVSGDPSYKSGPLEGDNRLLIWGAQVTPFVSPVLRIYKNAERIAERW